MSRLTIRIIVILAVSAIVSTISAASENADYAMFNVGSGSYNFNRSPSDKKEDIFLLPYFVGNGEAGIYLAYSRDGLEFKWLNDGKVIMPAPSWPNENLTRDPSILYHDGVFHMVWTTSRGSKSIGYASSEDLLHWSSPKKIDVWNDFVAVRNTWAPELHWDPEQNEFLIIWTSVVPEGFTEDDGSVVPPGDQYRTFCTRTRDFKSFSKATLFYSPKSGMGVVDPVIAHDDRSTADESDDRWVMVAHYMITPSLGEEGYNGSNLRLGFSKRMQGPYDAELGPPVVGTGTPIVGEFSEAPSLFKYNGLWYLYWDAPLTPDLTYCLATSPDLVNWTDRSYEIVGPVEKMRHGTVLVVPAEVVKAVLDVNLLP